MAVARLQEIEPRSWSRRKRARSSLLPLEKVACVSIPDVESEPSPLLSMTISESVRDVCGGHTFLPS